MRIKYSKPALLRELERTAFRAIVDQLRLQAVIAREQKTLAEMKEKLAKKRETAGEAASTEQNEGSESPTSSQSTETAPPGEKKSLMVRLFLPRRRVVVEEEGPEEEEGPSRKRKASEDADGEEEKSTKRPAIAAILGEGKVTAKKKEMVLLQIQYDRLVHEEAPLERALGRLTPEDPARVGLEDQLSGMRVRKADLQEAWLALQDVEDDE